MARKCSICREEGHDKRSCKKGVKQNMDFKENGSSEEENIFHSIKWENFFNLIDDMGDQLNGQKDRFDKSDIIEQAIEVLSDSKFKWVNENGWDHEYQD